MSICGWTPVGGQDDRVTVQPLIQSMTQWWGWEGGFTQCMRTPSDLSFNMVSFSLEELQSYIIPSMRNLSALVSKTSGYQACNGLVVLSKVY